jgi:hypothetical protein
MPEVNKIWCFIFALLCSQSFYAQDTLSELPLPVNNSTLIGIGSTELYDTYLSPLKYSGTSFRLLNEKMKQTSWFKSRFVRQQILEFELALAENPAKNAREYYVLLDYNWGGHYTLMQTGKFRLSAGALWNTSLGVLYNERNGNNPASARAYSNINISASAVYRFRNLVFRWQVDSPVAGILFSPHFGQSYYELSLGNTVGTANFASLHNQRAWRNYLTADFPAGKFTFRLGYLGSYCQTKVNDLQTHAYSNSFVIGLVSESINLSGYKLKQHKDRIKSGYYF